MHVMASRTHVQRVRILYKTILRLHRGLPTEIQPLGDNYVRDEFRRHKKCVESEAIIFLHEWTVSREAARPRTRDGRLCSPLPVETERS
jgi:protein gp37